MSTIAAWFAAIPKKFGVKESFVDHSTDQSHPPAKRGSAFYGTQLPRPPDFPTMPSTFQEQLEHFNDTPNTDRQGHGSVECQQRAPGSISCHYVELAYNSHGGHKPAYNSRYIEGVLF